MLTAGYPYFRIFNSFNEGYGYVDWLLTVPLLLFEAVATETAAKATWGALSTILFIFILDVLFVELSRAAKTQSVQVGKDLNGLRWLLLAKCCADDARFAEQAIKAAPSSKWLPSCTSRAPQLRRTAAERWPDFRVHRSAVYWQGSEALKEM